MSRPAASAALGLASVFVTLAALEIGARFLADPTAGNAEIAAQGAQARAESVHVKSSDPELIYVTRPDYRTNGIRISEAHGVLRAEDVPVAKPAGAFRVAVLGDSITAAHPLRVGGSATFSQEIERRLNAPAGGRRVEVLNFGTDGYSTLQEARLLETNVAAFAPDLVIVAYCLNDPANSYTPTVWFIDGAAPTSYLLDLVRRRLGFTPSPLSPAHPRYTHGSIDWNELYRPDGVAWLGVENALSRLARYGETRRIPVVLALFPLLLTGREPAEEQELAQRLYAQVSDAATRFQIRFVDLRAAFRGHAAEELRLLPEDPIHPNALGHRLAGERLAAEIERDVR
jgi:lysophospholipase L1-like esterase